MVQQLELLPVNLILFRRFFTSCVLGAHYSLQVEEDTKVAKDRIDLAKALIRASEKPTKPKKTKGSNETTGGPKDPAGEGSAADA